MDVLFVLYGSQLPTGCRWSNNGSILGEKLHITNITWTVRSFSPVVAQPEGFYVSEEDDVWFISILNRRFSVNVTYKTEPVYILISLLWRNIACQMLTEVIKTSLLPADACHSLQRCLNPVFSCFNRWSLWVKKKNVIFSLFNPHSLISFLPKNDDHSSSLLSGTQTSCVLSQHMVKQLTASCMSGHICINSHTQTH